jgi:hypothetical protein
LDNRHLLARAMASDFTVTWRLSQREQLFADQTPYPYQTMSLPAKF